MRRLGIIGAGGIQGTDSALAMLRAGADLVQVYTGFIYQGPLLPRTIARGLARQMDAEGAKTLGELIATSAPPALHDGAPARI